MTLGTGMGAWVLLAGLFFPLGMARAGGQTLPDSLVGLDGNAVPSSEYEGKVVLFVNVASKCGFTTQYEALQNIYETFKDRGFVVVGVPCNQFGSQEPGSAGEIKEFCSLTYGVQFPMLAKQKVNGTQRSPLYRFLIGRGTPVMWNFEKFLVGRDGKVIDRYRSMTAPDSSKLLKAIEKALGQ